MTREVEGQRSQGDAHMQAGRLAEALPFYRRAVALNDADDRTWWGLSCAALELYEYAEAVYGFQRLLQLIPGHGPAHHNLGKALFELGQVDEALTAFRNALACLDPSARAMPLGMMATIIPGSAKSENRAVRHAREAWAAHLGTVEQVPRLPASDPFGRALRLGYVSAFLARDNWMKPVWGLINNHDRSRFEVHLFSDGPAASIRHGYVPDTSDQVHDISGLSNAEAARRVAAAGIDLLIDLNGYSKLGRLPLFLQRPARVQAAWFNMYASSGLPCFDYLIGDATVIPAEEESEYTERIARVPGCYLTFTVPYAVPDVSPPPCAGRPGITFGCLAPQYKITPQVVSAFSRILQGCPDARLLLKSIVLGKDGNRRFVQDMFQRCGVPADRLILEGPAEHYEFLAAYAAIDLALDTFPYNGGTTTMEALWQGVPVLTFSGDRWAARISASLLRGAGLEEFIAADVDAFIAKAIDLGNDSRFSERLAELRRNVRDRLRQSSVCDARGFARAMEDLYLRMVQEHSQPAPAPDRLGATPHLPA